MTNPFNNVWSPRVLAALRIIAGLLFLAHGTVKLFGFPAGAQPGQVELLTLFGAGAILELVGGALLVLGLFTRPVAFVLSGEMAVAYFMFHAPSSFFPAVNGGDAAILFSFIFLYLAVTGPGAFSLDGLRARKLAAA
ncbi:DoxX family protein [Caulobacter sp. 17J80-11]|uniref:DoxX family protein n=1 Tax=Caulobacter sp. 17J80-11 TaxID=2763502 RepID=UPI001653C69C|nr:DoxX family protein [Caulobacter sp. 17J80-11]MBC6982969.1 DoxX family protein [Caulobacter sp. 17J80-11]